MACHPKACATLANTLQLESGWPLANRKRNKTPVTCGRGPVNCVSVQSKTSNTGSAQWQTINQNAGYLCFKETLQTAGMRNPAARHGCILFPARARSGGTREMQGRVPARSEAKQKNVVSKVREPNGSAARNAQTNLLRARGPPIQSSGGLVYFCTRYL